MNRFFSTLLDLLYPPKCPFCGKLTEKDGDICPDCLRTLPFTTHAGAAQKGEFFDVCLSPLYYEDKARQSLLRYKFGGKTSYCKVYARLMAETVRDHLSGTWDAVTWVPVNRRRRRTRGYDQAELLARELSRELGIPCRRTLIKVRRNAVQSSISEPSRRRANVSGVYRAAEEQHGHRLLLADDVITTGATLAECSRMLLMAGAEEVDCVTLVRKRD